MALRHCCHFLFSWNMQLSLPSKSVRKLIYWIAFSFIIFHLVYCIAFPLCPWPSDVVVTSYGHFFLQQRYSWDDLFDKATKDINKRVIFVTFYFSEPEFLRTTKDINKGVMLFTFYIFREFQCVECVFMHGMVWDFKL